MLICIHSSKFQRQTGAKGEKEKKKNSFKWNLQRVIKLHKLCPGNRPVIHTCTKFLAESWNHPLV